MLTFDLPKLTVMIKLIIYGILGVVIYRMVFLPAKEGYIQDSKPRIIKKKGDKPTPKSGEYTDYEEID